VTTNFGLCRVLVEVTCCSGSAFLLSTGSAGRYVMNYSRNLSDRGFDTRAAFCGAINLLGVKPVTHTG